MKKRVCVTAGAVLVVGCQDPAPLPPSELVLFGKTFTLSEDFDPVRATKDDTRGDLSKSDDERSTETKDVTASTSHAVEQNLNTLAEKLRPYTYEPATASTYVGPKPSLESIRRELDADAGSARSGAPTPRALPSMESRGATADEDSAGPLEDLAGATVFGADDRIVVKSCNWPQRTVVEFDSNCSGVFVGPKTLVTAAHCVRSNYQWRWYQDQRLSSGCTGKTTLPTTWRHGRVVVPGGWMASEDYEYDYAIVTYDAGTVPTAFTGWVNLATGGSGTHFLDAWGYGKTFVWPTVMSGWAAAGSDPFWRSSSLDASPGDSGGPWMWNDANDWPFVTGLASHESPSLNYAVKITSNVYSFFCIEHGRLLMSRTTLALATAIAVGMGACSSDDDDDRRPLSGSEDCTFVHNVAVDFTTTPTTDGLYRVDVESVGSCEVELVDGEWQVEQGRFCDGVGFTIRATGTKTHEDGSASPTDFQFTGIKYELPIDEILSSEPRPESKTISLSIYRDGVPLLVSTVETAIDCMEYHGELDTSSAF